MCGIAGIISYNSLVKRSALQQMGDALQHRGPEQEGYWISDNNSIGFAHRRLAIIDLSSAASQPMHYLHYSLVFNGEIYNYQELRAQLQQQGYSFLSAGDTEIIPAAYDCWGIDFLHRLDGMFAFALHNNRTNITLLVRDRFGEKPLYFTQQSALLKAVNIAGISAKGISDGLLFASEMKAFWATGAERKASESMLLNYMGPGFVQKPNDRSATFFKDIFSIPPGCFLQVNHDERKHHLLSWYNAHERVGNLGDSSLNEQQQLGKFSFLLQESVSRRLRSDVPIGTSLSGGIDSSAIVAVTSSVLQRRKSPGYSFNCFTASFPGYEKDETSYAREVADLFQLKQYTISPSANDCASMFKQLMYHQEEPVQSSSVFTQFMVYSLAKHHGITVLLDGQGADEILGGYQKYTNWYLQQLLRDKPGDFLKAKRQLQRNGFAGSWNLKHYAAAFVPQVTGKVLGKKALKQVAGLPHINAAFIREFTDEESFKKPVIRSLNDMLFYNTFQLGLEELLRYADRNSMAHSREVRLPFLYHELVEFLFSLPASQKIRQGFTKWILRKSMDGLLPEKIAWRTGKIGYEPPQEQWMQLPALREMVMESRQTLVNERILSSKIMDEPIVAKPAHEAGNYDWRYLNAAAIINEAL